MKEWSYGILGLSALGFLLGIAVFFVFVFGFLRIEDTRLSNSCL